MTHHNHSQATGNIIPFRPRPRPAVTERADTPSSGRTELADRLRKLATTLTGLSGMLGLQAERLGRVSDSLNDIAAASAWSRSFCDACQAATDLTDLAAMVQERDRLAAQLAGHRHAGRLEPARAQ